MNITQDAAGSGLGRLGKRSWIVLVLNLLLATSPDASAVVVSLGADLDNTIYSESGALSNGQGDHIFAGRTNDGFVRRALIAFDVSGIPAGSTVDAVTLTLHLSRTQTQDETVALHRVLAAWGEGASDAPDAEGMGAPAASGDATWTHRLYPGQTWATNGGDYDATASATTVVPKQMGDYSWGSAGLVADVQAWVNGTAPNHGWILIGNEVDQKVVKRFDSHDIDDVAVRPRLSVTYTPGATSTTNTTGTTSTTSTTLPPIGACCLPVAAATCLDVTESECATASGAFQGGATTCATITCPVVLEHFVDALPIPAVAVPVSGTAGGTATYRLAIREITQRLHRDLPDTTVWGFGDGPTGAAYPGPTIEASSGQPVTLIWQNDLRDGAGALRTTHRLPVDTCLHGADDASPRTVVHLHGGHVEAESDGYPEATFLPGEEVTYHYANDQLPGTLWYHDHALGITRLNVYMGLAGFYLVRDAVETGLGLPAGEFEIPLVIQDRTFAAGGSLQYPAAWQDHFFGDTLLVNGKVWPYLDVKQGKYRFRLLNGSTSRTYTLALSTGASLMVIGTEGGLLPAPVAVSELTLSPGERADVVVDFAPYAAGTEMLLTNSAPAPFPGTPGVGVIPEVMEFVVQDAPGHTAALPASLRPLDVIDENDAVAFREFELKKATDPCTGTVWLINGLGWDDITELPELGTTEVWSFVNRSGITHPMHMHLVLFQVLDRQAFELQGEDIVPVGPRLPPPAHEAGWKDTVQVGPDEIVRVIARFEDYKGKYPYHCHILEHEDHEMMRQFQTVQCGDGEPDPGEECDDGNLTPGDGCSPTCEIETCQAGECNGDGTLTTADVTCIILRLFDQIPSASPCEDCNDDGLLTTADVTCSILCLFGLCP